MALSDIHVPNVEPVAAEAAYETPHQYYFGSELLAAPHLRPRHEETNRSRRSVWLPAGEWFDFFSGEYYAGDAWHARYGDLKDRPIYAPGGAIVPMDPAARSDAGVPDRLRIITFPGADNTVDLYEDDGTSLAHREGDFATTRLSQSFAGDTLEFEIDPAAGELSHLPEQRDYEIQIRGIVDPETVDVDAPGEHAVTYREAETTLVVELESIAVTAGANVVVETARQSLISRRDRTSEHVEDLLWAFRTHVTAKEDILADLEREYIDWLRKSARILTTAQQRALLETITGAGVDRIDHDGGDRIVVWNPEDAPVTDQYSALDWEGEPNWLEGRAEHGPVPDFAVLDVSDPHIDGEVQLNYDDRCTITVESAPDEPPTH